LGVAASLQVRGRGASIAPERENENLCERSRAADVLG
jgi:hypothetical protein